MLNHSSRVCSTVVEYLPAALRMKITDLNREQPEALEFLTENAKNPVTLEFDSDGGNPKLGIELANAIEEHGAVTTVNLCVVMSAALYPFLAGKERLAKLNTRFMIHAQTTHLEYVLRGVVEPEIIFEKGKPGKTTGKHIFVDEWIHAGALTTLARNVVAAVEVVQKNAARLTKLLNGKMPEKHVLEFAYKDVYFTEQEARLWGILTQDPIA